MAGADEPRHHRHVGHNQHPGKPRQLPPRKKREARKARIEKRLVRQAPRWAHQIEIPLAVGHPAVQQRQIDQRCRKCRHPARDQRRHAKRQRHQPVQRRDPGNPQGEIFATADAARDQLALIGMRQDEA